MKKFLLSLLLSFSVASTTQAGMISLEKEIALGRDTGKQLEAQYGILQDNYQQQRINRIGQRLAKVCGREEIREWKFTVLNSKEINALACPGGFIYVFKGLIDYMPSDTEIAGVLMPSIGVITNIGNAHIGILGSQQAIAEEKKQIFVGFTENCVGFVPENDKFADFFIIHLLKFSLNSKPKPLPIAILYTASAIPPIQGV